MISGHRVQLRLPELHVLLEVFALVFYRHYNIFLKVFADLFKVKFTRAVLLCSIMVPVSYIDTVISP